MTSEPWYHAAEVAGIFLLSLLSEDSATLTGALLAALGNLPWSLAFSACFLGICVGDLGLYGLARFCGRPMISALLLRGETLLLGGDALVLVDVQGMHDEVQRGRAQAARKRDAQGRQ